MAWPETAMHPTVGMNGLQPPQQQYGGPPQGQQFIPQMQQAPQPGIGMPQYQGQVPVNGWTPQPQQPWGQQPQPQQQQAFVPQLQQPAQPHPTIGQLGQQMLPQQQPQMQPMQPQQPIGQPQRFQVQGHEILDGAGVPLELRGRTVQQVMQIYNTLAERELQRQRGQQQPQPGQPLQPQLGQPQQQPVQQPQQQTPFWQNPAQAVTQQVQQAVQQQLQPVNDFIQRNAVRDAVAQAQQMIPDFQQLQPFMEPILRGADPSNLARPEFWEGAADLARGRALRAQQQQQMQPQQQPQQAWGQQQRSVPAYPNFPQPTNTFFTEGPTPPMGAWGAQPTMQFTPIEQAAMQGMGLTPEQWMAYKGGVQSQRRMY